VDLFSRALGAKTQKQSHFANQIMMTFFWRHFCAIGHFFSADMLLFGAKGPIIKPATEFFTPLLFPFLSWHFV
jgi:hypothetical protein